MFGALGSEQTVRPLHRLTPLRDDPAFAWLTAGERLRIDALGWFLWVAFIVITFIVRQIVHVAIFVLVTCLNLIGNGLRDAFDPKSS